MSSAKPKTSEAAVAEPGQHDALIDYLGAYGSELDPGHLLPILCVARIQRIAAMIREGQEQAAQSFGLYAGDIYTLYLLQRIPEHAARPSDLANALTMTTGGMTKRLDRLEKAGMVRRDRDPVDRRGVVVVLTELGLRTAKAARATYRSRQAGELSKGLSEAEWAMFADLLQRAEKLLASGAQGAPPHPDELNEESRPAR